MTYRLRVPFLFSSPFSSFCHLYATLSTLSILPLHSLSLLASYQSGSKPLDSLNRNPLLNVPDFYFAHLLICAIHKVRSTRKLLTDLSLLAFVPPMS